MLVLKFSILKTPDIFDKTKRKEYNLNVICIINNKHGQGFSESVLFYQNYANSVCYVRNKIKILNFLQLSHTHIKYPTPLMSISHRWQIEF